MRFGRKPSKYQSLNEGDDIVDQAASNKPKITEAERARRQKEIDTARASVRLEGFILSPEVEELNRRYIAGEITGDEHSEAIRRKHGI